LIPHTLFFSGIRHLTAARAIITATFEPVVAIFSAFILLQEVLTPLQITGALLVFSAVLLLQIKGEELKTTPRAYTH